MLYYRIPPLNRYMVENPIIFHLSTDSVSNIEVEVASHGFANMLNPLTMTRNKYIDHLDNGALKDGAFDTTDFIELEPNFRYAFIERDSLSLQTHSFGIYYEDKIWQGGGTNIDGIALVGNDKYIRLSFPNDVPGYNPENYAVIKYSSYPILPEFVPYGYRYCGIYFPTGRFSPFHAEISIADILKSSMPEKINMKKYSVFHETDFSYLNAQVRFKQDSDTLVYTGHIYKGGISKRFMRYLNEKNTNIFPYKLLNTYKQFLLTTRTAGRHILIRESELYPLFFIALSQFRTYTIEALNGVNTSINQLLPGYIYAIDLDDFRKVHNQNANLPSLFKIKVNGDVIFDITIIPSAPVPNLYVVEFTNSYGVPERLEISGRKTSAPEFTDNAYDKYDEIVDDYIEQNERIQLREIINTEFGYKTLEEFLFARDMLQSDKKYLIDSTGLKREVRIKSESYEHDLHPVTPGSVPLEISFVDTETEFSPIPDESLPEGGIIPVLVTFHGNGGQTGTGESTVTLEVEPGTMWKDIEKPAFFNQGIPPKQQNGFTFVQGDDDTIVYSDFIVNNDIVVFASYSVIEIGVVTHHGEVYSAASWAAKYAYVNSPYCLYDYTIPSTLQLKAGHDHGNMIEFIYFKVAENRVFALRSSFWDGGVVFGSMNILIAGHYTPTALFPHDPSQTYAGWYPQGVLDDIVYFPDGVTVEAGKIPSAHVNTTNWATNPPDWNVFIDEKYGNGEEYTQILEDKFAALGLTSDALVHLRQQTDPFGLGKTMYIASIYECSLVAQHADKILSIFDTINGVFQSSGLTSTPVSPLYAAYRPNLLSQDSGFWNIHTFCVTAASGAGNSYVFSSNLHVRNNAYAGSSREFDTLRYNLSQGTTSIIRGEKNVGSLFLISLSDLF